MRWQGEKQRQRQRRWYVVQEMQYLRQRRRRRALGHNVVGVGMEVCGRCSDAGLVQRHEPSGFSLDGGGWHGGSAFWHMLDQVVGGEEEACRLARDTMGEVAGASQTWKNGMILCKGMGNRRMGIGRRGTTAMAAR